MPVRPPRDLQRAPSPTPKFVPHESTNLGQNLQNDEDDLEGPKGLAVLRPCNPARQGRLLTLRRQIPKRYKGKSECRRCDGTSDHRVCPNPPRRALRAGVIKRWRMAGFAHSAICRETGRTRTQAHDQRNKDVKTSNPTELHMQQQIAGTAAVRGSMLVVPPHMVRCTRWHRSCPPPFVPRCKRPRCSTPASCRFCYLRARSLLLRSAFPG